MNKTQQMQQIKKQVMDSRGCTNNEAVNHISSLVSRSPRTVYEWLSIDRPDIPEQLLELLKLKLQTFT